MSCPACNDCAAYMRRLVTVWYPTAERTPRRSHDEVVAERVARKKAISARREFNARKRAERAARAAKEATHGR